MYRVSYYMTAGSKTSKTFATIHEALRFSISSQVGLNSLYQIVKE
jgi:hypothetical protein